jgi:hypothetical protein
VLNLYLLLLAIISGHKFHTLKTNKFSSTYWVSSEPSSQPGQAVCGKRYIELIQDIFPSLSHIFLNGNSKVSVIYTCLQIETSTISGLYCTIFCRLRLEQYQS